MFARSTAYSGPSRTQLTLVVAAVNRLFTAWLVRHLGVDDATAHELADNIHQLLEFAVVYFIVPRLAARVKGS